MGKENMKVKIKRDDNVKVIAGKEKGKTGRVLRVDRINGRVFVQGLNMNKKAQRKKSQQDHGGIIEIEGPINISNVAVVTKNGEPTRVGYKIEKGKKIRIAKKTGEEL
ncbi:MAG: 50S ribosomal protein L24 [Spirochaetia bacterium]